MIRQAMLTSAFVLTLSLVALGARFTATYDSLESTVQQLQADLPASLDKTQKKAAKAYKSTLKKLRKDTDSLQSEIKLGKGIAGKLSKLGDPTVDGLLEEVATGLQGLVLDQLDAAQQRLGVEPSKVTPEKVQKQIDKGLDFMGRAADEDNVKKRLGFYGKAEARARKATKLLDKLDGGGGGGGDCPGSLLGAMDLADISRNEVPFGVDNYEVTTRTTEFGSFTIVSVHNCSDEQTLSITLPSPLTTGQYFGGSLDPATSANFFFGPFEGFGVISFNGSVEVTDVDGRLSLSFTTEFPDTPPFDGSFAGALDLPPIQ